MFKPPCRVGTDCGTEACHWGREGGISSDSGPSNCASAGRHCGCEGRSPKFEPPSWTDTGCGIYACNLLQTRIEFANKGNRQHQ
jgi:hypothetical protein